MITRPDVVDIREVTNRDVRVDIATRDIRTDIATPPAVFEVRLDDFSGPLELLLSLISKRKLEVTELALHQVTDDFVGYIRAQGAGWDLDETSQFLVVAATLLDLKAARLLPSGKVEDEEDLALLEAQDLLFARLLQYRAFKEVSAIFGRQILDQTRRLPRTAGLDPQFVGLLPDVIFAIGPDRFAGIAATALMPKVAPEVSISHIYSPVVSVAEQMVVIAQRLARDGICTFRTLVSDVEETAVIVGRFLALLELCRLGHLALDQVAALGDLHVRWIGPGYDVSDIATQTEFDQPLAPVNNASATDASAATPEDN